MSIDYKLVHDEPEVASIFSASKKLGELRNIGKGIYKLTNKDHSWILDRRIKGLLRPFSMIISEEAVESKKEILKVKDHLFRYRANFYMVGGIPELQNPRNHIGGSKYIIKLINFPHNRHCEIDEETKSRLKRLRGVPVGRISGLGSKGFDVTFEDELQEIGLPLAAATYLMYSSA